MKNTIRFQSVCAALSIAVFLFLSIPAISQNPDLTAGRTIHVDMVALDQPFFYNRMGAAQPTGMMFALKRDLVYKSGSKKGQAVQINDRPEPGTVMLRPDKRPRPFVLRCNEGDTIEITFTNLLYPVSQSEVTLYDEVYQVGPQTGSKNNRDTISPINYPRTRAAGVHAMGMEMVNSINDDASYVGQNENSFTDPSSTPKEYTIYAKNEGAFVLYSAASIFDQTGGLNPGALGNGLFGSVLVQPKTAEYYRSSVTAEDMYYATTEWVAENGTKIIRDKNMLYNPLATLDGKTIMEIQKTYFPLIDYQSKYPSNHSDWPGQYVLRMLDDNHNQIYNNLTAIITGPKAGRFPNWLKSPVFANVPASPDRRQPYREFAIHYHESAYTLQAFSQLYTPELEGTLSAGIDQFAINYASGGIASEILANRLEVGPVTKCKDCAYEEFFLSSWALGDPGTVVDVPANVNIDAGKNKTYNELLELSLSGGLIPNDPVDPTPGYKANKVLYPDDPANVVNSYMRDHVKMRVLHCGAGVPHVHHQHAHQWLHTPNSDDGHYLDSQILNHGTAWTMEMVYNGSGNRNQTVGDQIFHCHFYPHFAGGMWAMWRVHDVFETGTHLTNEGIPLEGSRAYPDAEIKKGTPIVGLVPVPTLAMAPIPGEVHIEDGQVVVTSDNKNPGFPFFIPGIAGSRAPHPPMDFAVDPVQGVLDGGLPRHVIVDDGTTVQWEQHTSKDFTKTMGEITAIKLPEEGTAVEQAAMRAHEIRSHHTITPEGIPASFTLNGLKRQQGAPFADPAINDEGHPVGTKRVYKAANIQLNAVFNKKGWHYPQQRIISLWEDVASTLNFTRPPEPLFFRANTDEYIEFWHSNLVPEYYELDDFQVRTPTDILGQHIHLVKFDVTSSDGAANGWNYEDGTFAPDMVQHRIHGINEGNLLQYKYDPSKPVKFSTSGDVPGKLTAKKPLAVWGPPPSPGAWDGAQTTIQRWYADPLLNNAGEDRTVRTVFSHDHYGPSTHQQAGLYAGLLVEPQGSHWFDPVTGKEMGTRMDGGPTSWQAVIQTADPADDYREFMLEFQDMALTYNENSKNDLDPYPNINDPKYYNLSGTDSLFNKKLYKKDVVAYTGWTDTDNVINLAGGQHPQLISISGSNGTRTVNYRSEPLILRTSSPNPASKNLYNPSTETQKVGKRTVSKGDLAYAMSSRITWEDPKFQTQPAGGSRISSENEFVFPKNPIAYGMQPTDPYTPLMRAYENDKIQLRTLVGAHQLPHSFVTPGQRWLFEPSRSNSSIRNSQAMGISEHFEFIFNMPVTSLVDKGQESIETQLNGQTIKFVDHPYIPSSDLDGLANGVWGLMRAYDVYSGINADSLMPLRNNMPEQRTQPNCNCPDGANTVKFRVAAIQHDLVYYIDSQGEAVGDTTAVVFVDMDRVELDTTSLPFTLVNANEIIRPLVLRANSGQCINVLLKNGLDPNNPDYFMHGGGSYDWGNGANENTYNYYNSTQVSLNPQAIYASPAKDLGLNIGYNNFQSIGPGASKVYQWYAGDIETSSSGDCVAKPIEFGGVNLAGPDYLNQNTQGLFGGLIIEPVNSNHAIGLDDPTQAYVYDSDGELLFREFVLFVQDNPNLFNYKKDPMPNRFGSYSTGNVLDNMGEATSNVLDRAEQGNQVPLFTVPKGQPLRIRLIKPGGSGVNTITFHGHVWPEEPFIEEGTVQGSNLLTQHMGSRAEVGAMSNYNLLIDKGGGEHEVAGDYLIRAWQGSAIQDGAWALVRVSQEAEMEVAMEPHKKAKAKWAISGITAIDQESQAKSSHVTLTPTGGKAVKVPVDPQTGEFSYKFKRKGQLKKGYKLENAQGDVVEIKPEEHIEAYNAVSKIVNLMQFKEPEMEEKQTRYINPKKKEIVLKKNQE